MDIRQFILPAGVGLTHIQVYDTPGPDGVISGGTHIHLVCSEIYYILKGTGTLETMDIDGVQSVDLEPNKVVFFRPGVFHRVLNPHKNLEILAIMQNGGLPERGDFVMSFPNSVLTNHAEYSAALRSRDLQEALTRRDLSLKGYLEIKDAFTRSPTHGAEALRLFYRLARNLIAPKVDGFEWVLKSGAQNEAKTSLDACDFIRSGNTSYLEKSRHAAIFPMNDAPRMGMCGQLHPYSLDESFLSEGKKVA